MFEAVREFIETTREFIELSFETLETFEWENKALFAELTFDTSEYFFTGRSIFDFRSIRLITSSPNLLITKFVTELFFL